MSRPSWRRECYVGAAIDADRYRREFLERGFRVFEGVLGETVVEEMRAALEAIPEGDEVRRKQNVYGIRNLLEISPAVERLAGSAAIRKFVTPMLGDGAFATRAIFFDKVAGANWALGWHQDSVISVRERRDVPGFTAWGLKAGVWQVRPPVEILASMVAVRVHLDDCGQDNGPLRVIPGSHRHGWIDDVSRWKREVLAVRCHVKSGGVVTMCPLLLHASSKAASPNHRRVIHIEFANQELPGGLQWSRQVGAR